VLVALFSAVSLYVVYTYSKVHFLARDGLHRFSDLVCFYWHFNVAFARICLFRVNRIVQLRAALSRSYPNDPHDIVSPFAPEGTIKLIRVAVSNTGDVYSPEVRYMRVLADAPSSVVTFLRKFGGATTK